MANSSSPEKWQLKWCVTCCLSFDMLQNLPFASKVDKDCIEYATMDDDMVDINLSAEIKEELPDDGDFNVTDVNSHLSDVETEEDDDDDVVIVDAEKTMQYLSGSRLILYGSISVISIVSLLCL